MARQRRFLLTVTMALLLATLAVPAGAQQPVDEGSGDEGPGRFAVEVLSSRPEYVSGGDARIAVEVPEGVALNRVRVLVDGRDVAHRLRRERHTRRLEGVVTGLPEGTSQIEVRAAGGRKRPEPAVLDVTNHPVAGPMFSGPHLEPFYCQTEEAGLGPALDEDCSAPTKVEFLYASTEGGFKPLPAGERPGDLRTTTTTTGRTVDYIVRLETGVINRAVYQTAVLYDPGVADTDSRRATRGWNGRLVYSYGGGCNAGWAQGTGNGGVLNDLHLSRGYGTASSSLNVLNNNCNDVLSAETTSMVKEQFIETYGADVHTMGWGGSGGAISQHLIAQNYPGLIDGVVATLPYPDSTSIFSGIGDCRLLTDYFADAPEGLWDFADRSAVAGFPDWDDCVAWENSFANRLDATSGCNPIVPPATVFDPETNPDGVRCAVADWLVNVLGTDPETGFAPQPDANVGVQYGLESLNAGELSVEQFLDLNAGIGGFDGNGEVVDHRSGPSPVIDRYYETGRVVTGEGLATTPIINVRPYRDDVTDIHTRFYTFALRERLLRDNGTAANQVIQIYGRETPPEVQAQIIADALALMDEWLTDIDSDPTERTAEEVIAAKPEGARDTCWDAEGNAIVQPASYDGDTACNALYPSFGDPRIEAGAPLTLDVLACTLRPLDRDDYVPEFTDVHWARMQEAFPDGVCDWEAPGVGQAEWAGSWQDFGPDPGTPGQDGALRIQVLSSPAGAVSGGDARIAIHFPDGVRVRRVRVTLGGENVTGAFREEPRGSGRLEGLVEGLDVGPTVLRATARGRKGERLRAAVTLRNHPTSGPIFSGPQQEPFQCSNEEDRAEAGLGPVLDEDCAMATVTSFLYRTTDGAWEAYDPSADRPADMATTVTMDGDEVDFVVR